MRRLGGFAVATALLSLLLTACATPSAHHNGNAAGGLFFDTPWEWSQIDPQVIDKAESGWKLSEAGNYLLSSIVWQSAWSAVAGTDPAVVFGNKPPQRAVVFAMVRKLYTAETDAVRADLQTAMSDLIVPLSTSVDGDGMSVTEDVGVRINGLQGWRQQLRWDVDGETQTLTSLAIIGAKQDRLYWVVARCADACPANDLAHLKSTIESITVKESSVG